MTDYPPPPDDPMDERDPAADLRSRFTPGGSFILDVPDIPPAVWGHGSAVAWAQGEALMVAGGNGLGKTTIAAQLTRCRIGLQSEFLGMPVRAGSRRVLYLAMDRPAQARRALRRVFAEEERRILDDVVSFWEGPPPLDLAARTDVLLAMCQAADADTVIVDSLKDAAVGLTSDEVGAAWNRARQRAIRAGVEVLELHHTVKRGPSGADPSSIADVYGSAFLTAGCGSVILLTGSPGDPIVQFRHVKQPMTEVGPWRLSHDHEAGTSRVWHEVDLITLVRHAGSITPKAAACTLFEKEKPTPAEVEKARRRLEALTNSGQLVRHSGPGSGSTYLINDLLAAAS